MAHTLVSQDQNNLPFPYGELGDTSRLDASSLLQRVNEGVSNGVMVTESLGVLLSGLERDAYIANKLVEEVEVVILEKE